MIKPTVLIQAENVLIDFCSSHEIGITKSKLNFPFVRKWSNVSRTAIKRAGFKAYAYLRNDAQFFIDNLVGLGYAVWLIAPALGQTTEQNVIDAGLKGYHKWAELERYGPRERLRLSCEPPKGPKLYVSTLTLDQIHIYYEAECLGLEFLDEYLKDLDHFNRKKTARKKLIPWYVRVPYFTVCKTNGRFVWARPLNWHIREIRRKFRLQL